MAQISVRCFDAHEWRIYRDLRLRSLADSPDAFGSTLAAEQDQSEEHWKARLGTFPTDFRFALPVVAELGDVAVGLAYGRIEPSRPELASLYQMWVAPDGRRRGAGRLLLDTVIEWARSAGAHTLELGVTCGDTPAARLYARSGFVAEGEPAPFREGSPLLGRLMRLDLRS